MQNRLEFIAGQPSKAKLKTLPWQSGGLEVAPKGAGADLAASIVRHSQSILKVGSFTKVNHGKPKNLRDTPSHCRPFYHLSGF